MPRVARPSPGPAASGEHPLELADVDPAAPAGDLLAELGAFTTVRDCVAKHRVQDPVVADALDAMGYDSFVGDACRSLRAQKDRAVSPCKEISSTALRDRCEANVAMLVGEESLCPLRERVAGLPEHDPLCLAASRRDVRPCAAFVGFDRASCEGLVARDVARCGTDPRCRRNVARWKSALPVPKGEAHATSQVELIIRGLDATADAGVQEQTASLLAEAEAGALVVRRAGSLVVLVGDLLPLPSSEVHAGFSIELPDAARPKAALKAPKARVTVRWPPGTVLELTPRSVCEVEVVSLTDVPNTPIELKLSAEVGERPSTHRVELRVRTWVRDVARPPARAVPDPSPFAVMPADP